MYLHSTVDCTDCSEKGGALRESDGSLRRLNNTLDKVAAPYVLNESQIEDWLDELKMQTDGRNPIYWLLLVRLNELALLCAGNYADNCEFSAAGDLLLNPRKIVVHFNDSKQSLIKKRHCSLTEQFRRQGQSRTSVLKRLADNATIEIKRPALLPHLYKIMQVSERVPGYYLDLAGTRMKRIAETIAFLASWQISDATELHRRISESTSETRVFIESHLCRFKNDLFFAIGDRIRRVTSHSIYQSHFSANISSVFSDEDIAHGNLNVAAQKL